MTRTSVADLQSADGLHATASGGAGSDFSRAKVERIRADPSYRRLVAVRAGLRWSLALATLVVFFGFVVTISAWPAVLRADFFGSGLPLSMVGALALIVTIVLLTGYYVRRSNVYLDSLASAVRREYER